MPFVYSEFTMYMQNQFRACSFVVTKAGILHYMPFFSYVHAPKWTVSDDPISLTHKWNSAIIFEQAINRFSK